MALFGLLLLAGAASALPTISIDVLPGGAGPQDVTPDGTFTTPNPPGEVYFWSLDAPEAITECCGFLNSWTVSAKEGLNSPPTTGIYVTNNINLTNTDTVAHTYLATVVLPISGTNYNAIKPSSVGATITDSNGNNSMALSEDGASFYRGQINGVTALSLSVGPLSTADCPFPSAGCSATDADSFAGGPSGPGVANSIAILLQFQISPGDSVGITSRFEIVPEPMTAAMVGLGLVGLGVAGRRRRHR
jgi:hypothetical protein